MSGYLEEPQNVRIGFDLKAVNAGVELQKFNSGLVYERFPKIWSDSDDKYDAKGESKGFFLETFEKEMNKLGQQPIMKECLENIQKRQEKLLDDYGIGKGEHEFHSLSFRVFGQFVTGIGIPNPVENGFCFDRFGLPFLPASGIKGLARAGAKLCKAIWEKERKNPDENLEQGIQRIFGSSQEPDNSGSVIFLDAYPKKSPYFKLDVFTPHYPDYYKNELNSLSQVAPGDWMSPIPIPFLTIENVTFQINYFPVSFKKSNKADILADLKFVQACLGKGLREWGVGAKRTSGYGFIKNDEKSKEENHQSIKIDLEQITEYSLIGNRWGKNNNGSIRPATLRGILRFWFRALVGGVLSNSNEGESLEQDALLFMRTIEAEIFGSAGAEKGNARERANKGLIVSGGKSILRILPTNYLRYPDFNHEDRFKKAMSLELQLANHKDQALFGELILASLWCWIQFGGTGSRSRHASGCFGALSEPEAPESWRKNIPDFTFSNSEQVLPLGELLKCNLNKILKRIKILLNEKLIDFKTHSKASGLAFGTGLNSFSNFSNYEIATCIKSLVVDLNEVIKKFKNSTQENGMEFELLRKYDSCRLKVYDQSLSRAVFGLPLSSGFKNNRIPNRLVIAVSADQKKIFERRSSPMFISISRLKDKLIWVVLLLKNDFLPTGSKLIFENERNSSERSTFPLPTYDLADWFLDIVNQQKQFSDDTN